jgi:hypothetical protein
MKALRVMVDGDLVGIFVPPEGGSFVARVGNIPRRYMRVHISAGTLEESWHWQLPDVQPNQTISFQMIEAELGTGVEPHQIRQTHPDEVEQIKKLAPVLMAKAFEEQAAEKRRLRGPHVGKRKPKSP